jgi:hypothetical protein
VALSDEDGLNLEEEVTKQLSQVLPVVIDKAKLRLPNGRNLTFPRCNLKSGIDRPHSARHAAQCGCYLKPDLFATQRGRARQSRNVGKRTNKLLHGFD